MSESRYKTTKANNADITSVTITMSMEYRCSVALLTCTVYMGRVMHGVADSGYGKRELCGDADSGHVKASMPCVAYIDSVDEKELLRGGQSGCRFVALCNY